MLFLIDISVVFLIKTCQSLFNQSQPKSNPGLKPASSQWPSFSSKAPCMDEVWDGAGWRCRAECTQRANQYCIYGKVRWVSTGEQLMPPNARLWGWLCCRCMFLLPDKEEESLKVTTRYAEHYLVTQHQTGGIGHICLPMIETNCFVKCVIYCIDGKLAKDLEAWRRINYRCLFLL